MTTAAFVARLLVGLVLLSAAAAKARSPRPFARSVRQAAALGGVVLRPAAAMALAVGTIAYELSVAVLFLVGAAPVAAGVAALCLVGLFAGVSALASIRKRRIECNCFGRSGTILGVDTLLRAALLAVPIVLYLIAPQSAWPGTGGETLSSLALVAGAVLLFCWTARALSLRRLFLERRREQARESGRRVQRRRLQRLRTI